jgi:hypothetical protein
MKKIALISIALAMIIMSGRCRYRGDNFFGGGRDGNYIKMTNGSVHEEIKYDGEIKISEDETSIDHISPNGYLLFIKNDEKLLIESNYHGEIVYELNDGEKKSQLNENEKKVLAELIKEMMAAGFDAGARVERIYKRGGNRALLNETDHLMSDNIKAIYFERVLSGDSISENELAETAKKISSQLGSDYEKEQLLNKFTSSYLKSPEAAKSYLEAIETLGSDNAEENLLTQLINKQIIPELSFDQFMKLVDHLGSDNAKENIVRSLISKDAIPADGFNQVFDVVNHLGSDNAKSNLLQDMIDKKTITQLHFDKALQLISTMGSDNEKANLYRKFIDANLSEEQWIALINATTQVGNDNEKSDLLIQILTKMPANENTRAAYMKAAKTIGSDSEFGRVMKEMK